MDQNAQQKGADSPPELTVTFPVWQTSLAAKIGVPVDDLRELRDAHLEKGKDWEIGSDNHVSFTVEAAEKLAQLVMLGQAEGEVKLLPPSTLTPDDVPMIVKRGWPMIANPKVIEAELTADGQHHAKGTVVIVRVKNNRPYRKGMELQARHFQGLMYDVSSRVPKTRV